MNPVWLSLIICVIGMVIYYFNDQAKHPKVDALALYAFACGLLAFLLLFKGSLGRFNG